MGGVGRGAGFFVNSLHLELYKIVMMDYFLLYLYERG